MGTFIRNLRFAHKFLLISLLAGLMLALPTVIFVRGNLERIASAKLEVSGLAPIKDVMKLTQLSQQHRGLSAGVLAGNEAQATARQAKAPKRKHRWPHWAMPNWMPWLLKSAATGQLCRLRWAASQLRGPRALRGTPP